MRKWTKGVMSLLSAAVMTLAAFPMQTSAYDIDWVFFNTQIEQYVGEEKDIICPQRYGGKDITGLQSGVFYNKKIHSIQLPSKLVAIGGSTFENSGLGEIDLPNTLITISDKAFKNNKLTYIAIPQSVQKIGVEAFSANPNLTINLLGRTSTDGLTLGNNWSGSAKVVFNEPLPEDPPMQSGDTANVAVEGKVEPVTTMNLDVPVTTTFLIDANRDFIAPEFEIVNHSTIPVQVTAVSLTADSRTTAKVVEHDAHTEEEWHNLNKADTLSQIGLGLKISDTSSLVDMVPSETLWFGAEGTDSNLNLGKIKSAYGSGEAPKLALQYDARYGKLWGNPDSDTSLSYTMVLTFSAE